MKKSRFVVRAEKSSDWSVEGNRLPAILRHADKNGSKITGKNPLVPQVRNNLITH